MTPVALIWKYEGKDRSARLSEIEGFDYPDFRIISIAPGGVWLDGARLVPRRVGTCLFWLDNHKPVEKDFVQQMVRPLSVEREERAVVHFWAGNALAVSKKLLKASSLESSAPADSLWRLFSPILDLATPANAARGGIHVAFSSVERLAPMTTDPVGFPC